MKNILKPTEVLQDSIDTAKTRVKVAVLKAAGVVEHETAFKSWHGGWQIAFYMKNKQDTLKVIAVGAANDFECGSATKEASGNVWTTYINLDEKYK